MAERTAAAADAPTDALAQPFNQFAAKYNVPLSTMQMLRARGKGPRCFRIGRLLYVSRRAEEDWIASLEQEAEAAA